jgi:hypothetical protein
VGKFTNLISRQFLRGDFQELKLSTNEIKEKFEMRGYCKQQRVYRLANP